MRASQMRQLAKVTELIAASEYDKAAGMLYKMITNTKDSTEQYMIHVYAHEVGFAKHPLFN